MHRNPPRSIKTAFFRSSILPPRASWSSKSLHCNLVILIQCYHLGFDIAYSSVPLCVTFCKVIPRVDTKMVWFAVTATSKGFGIYTMFPAIIIRERNVLRARRMIEEVREIRRKEYHWAAPFWACYWRGHKQAAIDLAHQSIFHQVNCT